LEMAFLERFKDLVFKIQFPFARRFVHLFAPPGLALLV